MNADHSDNLFDILMKTAIYMFHAIDAVGGVGIDPHYSYSRDDFFELVNALGQVSSIKEAMQAKAGVKPIITFDDGHISNYELALELAETGLGTADFFVNPSTVGSDGFMSWDQLQELNKVGMSIQSHCYEHIYLSDLSFAEQQRQLSLSKQEIEEHLGEPVTVLAPPNGRYNQDTLSIAKDVGYDVIAVSKPGLWAGKGVYVAPRLPVLAQMPPKMLFDLAQPMSTRRSSMILKYQLTGVMKKLLGTEKYNKFRQRMLS